MQSFTARMPLLTAISAFRYGIRCWSSPQQCYLRCLHTVWAIQENFRKSQQTDITNRGLGITTASPFQAYIFVSISRFKESNRQFCPTRFFQIFCQFHDISLTDVKFPDMFRNRHFSTSAENTSVPVCRWKLGNTQ